jgi:hypothetical protein
MADHEPGPPLGNLVQIAYVTTDLAKAISLFQTVYGVNDWLDLAALSGRATIIIHGRDGTKTEIRAVIAYVGVVQFELIEPVDDPSRLYRNYLPDDHSFAVRLHHLGFGHARPADVRSLEHRLAEHHAIPLATESPRMPVFYADARKRLGHYLEYFSLPADVDRLIPRN